MQVSIRLHFKLGLWSDLQLTNLMYVPVHKSIPLLFVIPFLHTHASLHCFADLV